MKISVPRWGTSGLLYYSRVNACLAGTPTIILIINIKHEAKKATRFLIGSGMQAVGVTE